MSILTMEDGLVVAITAALAGRVKAVESLPGNWDDDTMKRLLRQVPGVYVSWVGGQTANGRDGGVAGMTNGVWIVYVATGHASGEAARRRGDSQQVGAYELLDILIPLLNGFVVPGEGSLSLVRVENLYSGTVDRQGLCLYAMHFNMPMSWPTTVNETGLTPFETFAPLYDIPAHSAGTEHRKWLAGDLSTSKPDASDVINLPQP